METLSKIFGSPVRLKLLRLFFFNENTAFTLADAVLRAKVSKAAARKEIALLEAATAIKRRSGKSVSWAVNKQCAHYDALLAFLSTTTSVKDSGILAALKRAGTLRLVVLSGLFTDTVETKIDLLIVGDRIEERPLSQAIQKLEAELGREIRYAAFPTRDFRYRQGVYDRLIRDVFDYPRRTILDKIGV